MTLYYKGQKKNFIFLISVRLILFHFLILCNALIAAKSYSNSRQVDLIVFSFDRPLQLYAYLESIEKYINGINKIYAFYKTSNQNFKKAYQQLKNSFSTVCFVEELNNIPDGFKKQFLHLTFSISKTPYIFFGVDDIIVTDFINLDECVNALEKENAYGFYLRLGKNVTQSYIFGLYTDQNLPPLKKTENGFYLWIFKEGSFDWQYPNTLDMTLYRKNDLKEIFYNLGFSGPNRLESNWAQISNLNATGLCFEHSKIINLPLNQVQNDEAFRSNSKKEILLNYLSSEEALTIFNKSMKIDIKKFFKFANKSPHIVSSIPFVTR